MQYQVQQVGYVSPITVISLHRGVIRLSRLVARKLDTANTGID